MVRTLEVASYCEIVPERAARPGFCFEFVLVLLDELVDAVALPLSPQATRRPVAMSKRKAMPTRGLRNVRTNNFFILLMYILVCVYKS
jgi:hypothetical protein